MSESRQLPLIADRLQRPLRDLRVSVTDRCNFRCTYCMPRAVFGPGYEFLHKSDLLSFEEITRLASVFTRLGVRKLRLTGGEPLLRRDLEHLVAQLRTNLPALELALTTNGSLLAQKAHVLRAAGLHRLTISLDALDSPTFQKMNDAGVPVQRVLEGVDAAIAAGFSPIKLNCVIKRGVNEHAITDLATHFSGVDHIVRFIEYMDVGNTNGWQHAHVVPAKEIASRLEHSVSTLTTLAPNHIGEVARRYRTSSGGEIGIISSVTQPFCQHCNRARLSSDGQLYTCLFGSHGVDLRTPLRSGATDDELEALIRRAWSARDDRYSEQRSSISSVLSKVEMSAIGG